MDESPTRRRHPPFYLDLATDRRASSPVDARQLESELEDLQLTNEGRVPLRPPKSPQPQNRNLCAFLWAEVTRGYSLQNDPDRFTEKRKKVYTFIQIPRELEKFLLYGFLQCADAFLYFFTFLPARFVMALINFVLYPIFGHLDSSEICDLLKVTILVATTFMLQFVDTSVVYHLVRGQSVIKLYIFYNMLEVADKLFSSFGQDILDALWWTATEPKSSRKVFPHLGTLTHLALATVYVFLHALLVLLQATTLNVAFNSHNKALLTIMMSNNFVELKGSVFKKFAKGNLFQMACSDARERFHYVILLSIVVVRNMTAVNWKSDHFWEMAPDLALVFLGEFIVDWFKHAFITKFNEIPAEVYKDFSMTIAYDVMRSRQADAFSDYSDQVSRRMGFIPLPVTALLIRVLMQSLKFTKPSCFILLALGYVALILLKTLNSIVLVGRSIIYVERYEALQQQAELLERIRLKKSKSVPSSPKMPLVDFSDIMQQQHRPIKGLTMSDVLSQLSDLQEDKSPVKAAALLPRRSQSTAYLSETNRRKVVESSTLPIMENALEPLDLDAPGVLLEKESETQNNSEQSSPRKVKTSECESLQAIDRYTLLNNDRIEL